MKAPIRPRSDEDPEAFRLRVVAHLQGRTVLAKSYFGYCRRCRSIHKISVRRKLVPLAFAGAKPEWLCEKRCLAERVAELAD